MPSDEMNGQETVTPLVIVCTIVLFLSALVAGIVELSGGKGSVLLWGFCMCSSWGLHYSASSWAIWGNLLNKRTSKIDVVSEVSEKAMG